MEAIPTWVEDTPKLRLIDIPRALADPAISTAQRTAHEQAYTQIRAYLDAYGAIKDGLVVVH